MLNKGTINKGSLIASLIYKTKGIL